MERLRDVLVRCKAKVSPSIPTLTLQNAHFIIHIVIIRHHSGSVHRTVESTSCHDEPAKVPHDTTSPYARVNAV